MTDPIEVRTIPFPPGTQTTTGGAPHTTGIRWLYQRDKQNPKVHAVDQHDLAACWARQRTGRWHGQATEVERATADRAAPCGHCMRILGWAEDSTTYAYQDGTAVKVTRRQAEILQLLADGHTSREVAQRLWVSMDTVKSHISNVIDALGAGTRVGTVAKAMRLGLIH